MYQLHHHGFHVCLLKKQNASLQSTGAEESEASGQSLDHVKSIIHSARLTQLRC